MARHRLVAACRFGSSRRSSWRQCLRWCSGIPADAAGNHGVLDGKREAAESDARQAVSTAQQQLDAADLTGCGRRQDPGGSGDELRQPLERWTFETIILARGQTVTAGQADASSIPANLREQVDQGNALLITPTEVHYRDDRPPVAGLAAGSTLTLPGTERYQIYLIFPLTQEVDTLNVLRTAVLTTGAILVILLTFIAALVSRQVVTPVRRRSPRCRKPGLGQSR